MTRKGGAPGGSSTVRKWLMDAFLRVCSCLWAVYKWLAQQWSIPLLPGHVLGSLFSGLSLSYGTLSALSKISTWLRVYCQVLDSTEDFYFQLNLPKLSVSTFSVFVLLNGTWALQLAHSSIWYPYGHWNLAVPHISCPCIIMFSMCCLGTQCPDVWFTWTTIIKYSFQTIVVFLVVFSSSFFS